jgi:hypothetical protein
VSHSAGFQIFVFPNGKVLGQAQAKKGSTAGAGVGTGSMIEPGISMVLANLEVDDAVVPPEDLLLLCLSEIAVQDEKKGNFLAGFEPLQFGPQSQCSVHEKASPSHAQGFADGTGFG